ncbi:MAG: hypothetical protein RL660_252 [Bacteroidota bacterium]
MLMLAAVCAAFTSSAQGIKFEKGKWDEIIATAKKQNKLIYLDVYTSWCGPCKMMAKKFFPDKEVGEFYNENFVNVSIDAEKGEGIAVAKTYHVTAYPTNLFINPASREVVYKAIGAPEEASDFIGNGKRAVEEFKDPMTLEQYAAKFKKGKVDSDFVLNYLGKLQRVGKPNDAVIDYVVSTASFADQLGDILPMHVTTINNKGFDWLVENAKNAPSRKDMTSEDFASLQAEMAKEKFWRSVEIAIENRDEKYYLAAAKKFDAFAPKERQYALSTAKMFYDETEMAEQSKQANINLANFIMGKSSEQRKAENEAQVSNFEKSIRYQFEEIAGKSGDELESAIKQYKEENAAMFDGMQDRSDINDLNSAAWMVFEKYSKDKALVGQAITWTESARLLLKGKPIEDRMAIEDTYACLLYRAGRVKEAIATEQSVVDEMTKAEIDGVADYAETLAKMKAGKL